MDDPSVPLSVLCTMDQPCGVATTWMSASATPVGPLLSTYDWIALIGVALAVGYILGLLAGQKIFHKPGPGQ